MTDPRLVVEEQKPCAYCGGPIYRRRLEGYLLSRREWNRLRYCGHTCRGKAMRGRTGVAVWRNCRVCHRKVRATACRPHPTGGWVGPCCAGEE